MPSRSALSLTALALMATTAHAADLPVPPTVGEIFAEPADGVVAVGVYERPITIPPWPYVAGYYGPHYGAFYYQNYYGTPPWDIFFRRPYSCLSYAC